MYEATLRCIKMDHICINCPKTYQILFLHLERIITNVQIFHNISRYHLKESRRENSLKERNCLFTEKLLKKFVLLVIDSS